jgi:hypothetical protein
MKKYDVTEKNILNMETHVGVIEYELYIFLKSRVLYYMNISNYL